MRLREFVLSERQQLLELMRTRLQADFPTLSPERWQPHIEALIDQLAAALASGRDDPSSVEPLTRQPEGRLGAEHASAHLPVAMVVRELGGLSDAIGVLSQRRGLSFTAAEYHVTNLIIDSAMAAAVDAYTSTRSAQSSRAVTDAGQLAHELRNALGSALLAHQVLRDGKLSVDSRTGDILQRNLQRALVLMDRLLFSARQSSPAAGRRERTGVLELVSSVAADVEAPRDVTIHVDVDPELDFEVEPTTMVSVLGNLLLNAVKYTRSGTTVTVSARVEDQSVVIDVADQCGGLPPGAEEHLFEAFERNRLGSGNGLGLSIVKEGVAAHGGQVKVHNRPGVGCVFTVIVPAHAAECVPA